MIGSWRLAIGIPMIVLWLAFCLLRLPVNFVVYYIEEIIIWAGKAGNAAHPRPPWRRLFRGWH